MSTYPSLCHLLWVDRYCLFRLCRPLWIKSQKHSEPIISTRRKPRGSKYQQNWSKRIFHYFHVVTWKQLFWKLLKGDSLLVHTRHMSAVNVSIFWIMPFSASETWPDCLRGRMRTVDVMKLVAYGSGWCWRDLCKDIEIVTLMSDVCFKSVISSKLNLLHNCNWDVNVDRWLWLKIVQVSDLHCRSGESNDPSRVGVKSCILSPTASIVAQFNGASSLNMLKLYTCPTNVLNDSGEEWH
jgi:hypothetical protein